MIIITTAMKSKSKKWFQNGVRVWFFSATTLNEINEMEKDKYDIVSGRGAPFRAREWAFV